MTTRKLLGFTTIALALCFSAGTAAAHHSRANFDLDKTEEFDGTVTRLEWTNPHTAIVVDVQMPDGKTVTKTFEGNSVATMIRRGFTKTSVKPGDKVHIVANPEKAEGSQFYYLNSITVNGEPIGRGRGGRGASNQQRDSPTDAKAVLHFASVAGIGTPGRDAVTVGGHMRLVASRASVDSGRYSYLNAAFVTSAPAGGGVASWARNQESGSAAQTEALRRFVGVWRQGFGGGGGGPRPPARNNNGGGGNNGGGNAILLGRPTPSDLPVTAKGAASYAEFHYADDPRNICVPESLPSAISSAPYLFGIRLLDNGNLIFENENYAAPRIIHMGQDAPPAGTKPDYDGYSVGHLEDGVLVVETTLFSPEPWGNDTGLTSSDQKHFIERLTVTDTDRGKRLQDAYVQTDPVYLSEPVTRTVTWNSTDAELTIVWDGSLCTPEGASRHLTEGHNPFDDDPNK